MAVRDAALFAIVERIKEHYENNINNVYVRKAFSRLEVPHSTWDQLDSLTTKVEFYRIHGYPLQDLYEQILAAAAFISACRRDLLPNLRSMLADSSDRTLTDMAINNFRPNLSIFADMVNELYVKAAGLDREERGNSTPVYESIPELKKLGDYLIDATN